MPQLTRIEINSFYKSLLNELIEKVPSAPIAEADYLIRMEMSRLQHLGTLTFAVQEGIGVSWSIVHGFEYDGDEPMKLENI